LSWRYVFFGVAMSDQDPGIIFAGLKARIVAVRDSL